MPWKHDLNPYALGPFDVGQFKGLGIRWYGLAYITGFVLAYQALRRATLSGRVGGLDLATLENLLLVIVFGVLVGGRMGFVVQHLDQWRLDPFFPLKLHQGGMAFFGGLAGVVICFLWFRRRHGLNLWELGDVVAPVAAFSLGIGRVANFVNGELWGKKTGSDWGVLYPMRPDAPRHPSELYECATHLVLGVLLLVLARTPAGKRLGTVSAAFLIGYGLLRCVTEVWREQEYSVGPFSAGQIASLVTALVGVVLLFLPNGENQQKYGGETAPSGND